MDSSLWHLVHRDRVQDPPALLTTCAAVEVDATAGSVVDAAAPVAPAVVSLLGLGTGCCAEADALRGTVRTFVCLAGLGGVGALADAVIAGTARCALVRRAELDEAPSVVLLTLARSSRAARAAAAAAADAGRAWR